MTDLLRIFRAITFGDVALLGMIWLAALSLLAF